MTERFYYIHSRQRMMAVIMEKDVSNIDDLLVYAKKKYAGIYPKATWENLKLNRNAWILTDEIAQTTGKILKKKVLEIYLLISTEMR